MKIPLLFTLSAFISINAFSNTDIYVNFGDWAPPYYEFYSDSDGTIPLDIGENGNDALIVGESYTFRRLSGAVTHPFYLSNLGNNTISGDGSSAAGITGTQSFVLTINEETAPTFYCTAHPYMTGTLNVSSTPISSYPKVGTSELFSGTTNSSWPFALTVSPAGSAGSDHSVTINITSLPDGGALYRWPRTVANGQWYMGGNGQSLSLGEQTLTLPSVNFDRAVKLQFSSGNIEFSSLTVDGANLYGEDGYNFVAPAGSVLTSSIFDVTGNGSWPYAFTAVTTDDGTASHAQQVFNLNVTDLPDGGAQYSVYKTTANGNDYTAAGVDLILGENIITVAAVDFDRTVKLRISKDIAIDSLSTNGVYAVGEAPQSLTIDENSVLASTLLESSENTDWPYVLTAVTTDDETASQAQQVINLNVTDLPDGGAQYSVYKTTANGNDYIAAGVDLILGENIITVAAVDFDRTVKLRISDDVAIDNLTVNGTAVLGVSLNIPEGSVAASTVFEAGDNSAWPLAVTSGNNKGASQLNGVNMIESSSPQHFILNVTAIPDGGAQYSIAKTVADGNWHFDAAQDLELGENIISIDGVDFDRTVKLRLSTDVGLSAAGNNGEYYVGENPVQISESFVPTNDGNWYFRTGTPMNSGLFNGSSNADWPFVYKTISTPADGALSQNPHVFVIHVFEKIPGAKASIARTVANGNWDIIEQDLELGWNVIHVRASNFDRSVKFRLSTHLIGFNYFAFDRSVDSSTPLNRYIFNNTSTAIQSDGGIGFPGAAEASSTFYDADNDGIYDIVDAFPSDPNEFKDADNDGVGSNSDPDDSDPDNPPSEAPLLSIAQDYDTNDIILQWDDANGFELKVSDDLNTWNSTGDSESPYQEPIGSESKFYKLSND